MLRDQYRQLLTAYVDGELSSRQRRHVARLLRRSPEARLLLQQLQADAQALRQLPQPPLPADLSNPVLHRIAERRLTPGQSRIAQSASTTPWMGPLASWAAAAAVLFLLGLASYLYFAASLVQPEKVEVVHKQPGPASLTPPAPIPHSPTTEQSESRMAKKSEDTKDRKSPKADSGKQLAESGKPSGKAKPNAPDKPLSPPQQDTALTERLEMFPLHRVPDLLPVIVPVSDLDREPARKQLLTELGKDREFRIELPCPNGTKALDRVGKASRTLHLGLLIDKHAQERIKQKWRTSYVLYLEDVTPEELIHFVRQIGAEDRKSAAGKPAEVQIDRLVLSRLTARHRKELIALLGVDPAATVPSDRGPLGADPRKSLSDETARQVGQALAGSEGAPRPASGKPPEHIVLVLPYSPARPASGSDEIKHFLEGRKPARAGTLRVLLVLRSG
jgi:hypothetical protein